ncbi:MAG: Maf family protein [Fibrobacterota bacterium]
MRDIVQVMIDWQIQNRRVILASGSPRRKIILEQMGLSITVVKPHAINEQEHINSDDLDGSIQKLASLKASEVAKNNPDALVIGADTIVVRGKRVLGKPTGVDDAREMLRFLSGNVHTVMTGVALRCESLNYTRTIVESTDVYFRDIQECEIDHYLTHDEYVDKAGSYAIQGRAMIFIDKIAGCYYNVVGLPVSCTINLLKAFIVRKESADV